MEVIIYWILDLEGEMHSIWDLWKSGLQECKGNGFFKVGWGGQQFSVGYRNSKKDHARLPQAGSYAP